MTSSVAAVEREPLLDEPLGLHRVVRRCRRRHREEGGRQRSRASCTSEFVGVPGIGLDLQRGASRAVVSRTGGVVVIDCAPTHLIFITSGLVVILVSLVVDLNGMSKVRFTGVRVFLPMSRPSCQMRTGTVGSICPVTFCSSTEIAVVPPSPTPPHHRRVESPWARSAGPAHPRRQPPECATQRSCIVVGRFFDRVELGAKRIAGATQTEGLDLGQDGRGHQAGRRGDRRCSGL